MKLWRWEHGRQGGGYSKFTLAYSTRLNFDMYILRLPKGSMVQEHTDPSPEGFEHHRVNITLRSARTGGCTYFSRMRAPLHYHFRPDVMKHHVTAIMKGNLWLLSIGWLRRAR